MSKEKESFEFEVEEKGKTVKRGFCVTEATLQQQNEATKEYNRAFRNALESGALLRAKLDDYMRDQGMWDEEQQAKLTELQRALLEKERKIAKGGIRLSVAKDVAIEMSDQRAQIRELLMEKNSLDTSTAEGQADNARFDYLVSATLVYDDSKKPYFKNLADYRNRNTEPVAIEGARRIAQNLYGLDSDHEHKLAENKFLKEFNFVDGDLRLINDDGHLIDREGNLVNDLGRFVDEEGNLIDREGNPVDEDGDYSFDRAPFLDDDGEPIVKAEEKKPEAEEEAETTEEVEAEATEEVEAETTEEVKAEITEETEVADK